jgi:hypothetical protein
MLAFRLRPEPVAGDAFLADGPRDVPALREVSRAPVLPRTLEGASDSLEKDILRVRRWIMKYQNGLNVRRQQQKIVCGHAPWQMMTLSP